MDYRVSQKERVQKNQQPHLKRNKIYDFNSCERKSFTSRHYCFGRVPMNAQNYLQEKMELIIATRQSQNTDNDNMIIAFKISCNVHKKKFFFNCSMFHIIIKLKLTRVFCPASVN